MKQTVFIIGAGASSEVNLPVGKDLKNSIAELLNIQFDWDKLVSGDYLIAQAFRHKIRETGEGDGTINPYLHEAWHIRDALPQAISIDNFIDSQRGNPKIALCGKLAIVRAILEAESNSALFIENPQRNSFIFSELENTWYIPFFQLLTENCVLEDLKERLSSVSLIIFNYDRCVEHFLLHALKNYYRISEQESAEIISHLNIFHPYGSVGPLQWQSQKDFIGFGQDPSAQQLLALTQKIKTFTEGTDPTSGEITKMHRKLREGDIAVFLGFAFHKLNMRLLTSDQQGVYKRCFATTLGISESDKVVIESQISSLHGNTIKSTMSNTTCKDLFSEFWRSIAF